MSFQTATFRSDKPPEPDSGEDPRHNIPARPFLVLFPDYEEEIIDILTDYLVGTK